MMISTILLVANLIALIFAEPFMSFWWNIGLYFIEIFIYFLFILLYFCVLVAIGRYK